MTSFRDDRHVSVTEAHIKWFSYFDLRSLGVLALNVTTVPNLPPPRASLLALSDYERERVVQVTFMQHAIFFSFGATTPC